MGLDISAYSHLARVGHFIRPWCEQDGHIQAYAYDSFTQSFRGIEVVDTDSQFIYGGCFATTDATVQHSFRGGSYGGYNRWRADLQEQFNPDRDPAKPFYELIWFADNEGTIGPDAAADLAKDFETHASRYQGDAYDQERYGDFHEAAVLASRNGLIDFH